MKAQRALKLLVVQNRGVKKAGQNRLSRSGIPGLVADPFPYRVTVLHLFDAVSLGGCHGVLLRRLPALCCRETKGSPVPVA